MISLITLLCSLYKVIDYRLLLVVIPYLFILTLNADNYIVEVFEDRFNLVLPSLYGDRFAKVNTYYFKEIQEFSFQRGYFHWTAAFVIAVLGLILPVRLGPLFPYVDPNIYFRTNDKEVTVYFSYNQNSLVKVLEYLGGKIG